MDKLIEWITQNQDQIGMFFLGLISIGGLIFLVGYYSKKAVVIRTLQKFPKTAISSLQENQLVKVMGKAKPIKEVLNAPLSGRKCVYYSVKVEQKSGGRNQHWVTIIDDEIAPNFLIESYSGKALIKMKNFKSYFIEDAIYKSGHFNDATNKLEHYLEVHGKKSISFLGLNKTLRYKEAVIEVGEKIAVMGTVKYENISPYGLTDSYSKIPVLQSIAKNKLIISDDPKALIEKTVS
ncbi:MAG: hypothetical protein QM486_05180 [Flavobacteriaceae bacterium]